MENIDIDKRLKEVNDALLAQSTDETEIDTKEEVIANPAPVDNYQVQHPMMRERLTPRSYGGSSRVPLELNILEDGRLRFSFKKAKDEVEAYRREGDNERARLRQAQYMQDEFLPVIDALAGLNGADALLANPDALSLLDSYVLVDGGSRGYTASFIASLYDSAPQPENSDSYIRTQIAKLKALCGDGQIRTAVGLANQLKNVIEKGEHRASPEDYEIIQKVLFKTQG